MSAEYAQGEKSLNDEFDHAAEAQSTLPSEELASRPVVPELSQLMVHLLKGVLYREEDQGQWASLLRLQSQVREQAGVLLLDLVLDEAEGYAFLKSRPDAEEADAAPRLPRLVVRRPLS